MMIVMVIVVMVVIVIVMMPVAVMVMVVVVYIVVVVIMVVMVVIVDNMRMRWLDVMIMMIVCVVDMTSTIRIVVREDVCPVIKVCSTAGEDVSACPDHVRGERKLLAVEDKEVSISVESVLAVSALSLETRQSAVLIIDLFVDVLDELCVVLNLVSVVPDVMVVLMDAVIEGI